MARVHLATKSSPFAILLYILHYMVEELERVPDLENRNLGK